MIDYRNFQATSNKVDINKNNGYSYKNIPIKATIGIHEKVFEIVKTLNLDKDANILILGSGYGSFDLRLLDYGFNKITSIDFNDTYLLKDKCNFIIRDLNYDFSDIGKFDLIIAIEIIEHLENHAHFLRNISSNLNNGGKVIISSPNVENAIGRIKYLFTKTLPYFNSIELEKNMHISPIFELFFLFHVKNANLKLVKRFSNRNVWKAQFGNSFFRKILAIFFFILSRLLSNKNNEGEINIYLLEK